MKQVYKKKPEYLDVVFVADDTQSIKEVYELAGVTGADITFNENGERVINIMRPSPEENISIPVGYVAFKDKKSGKLIAMPQEKLLQFYDVYNDEVIEPETKKTRKISGELDE